MRHAALVFAVPLFLAAQGTGRKVNPPDPLAAANAAPATAPEDLGSIQGQVLNAYTGEPVRKATLTLRRMTPNPTPGTPPTTYSATSDAAGKFANEDVE